MSDGLGLCGVTVTSGRCFPRASSPSGFASFHLRVETFPGSTVSLKFLLVRFEVRPLWPSLLLTLRVGVSCIAENGIENQDHFLGRCTFRCI